MKACGRRLGERARELASGRLESSALLTGVRSRRHPQTLGSQAGAEGRGAKSRGGSGELAAKKCAGGRARARVCVEARARLLAVGRGAADEGERGRRGRRRAASKPCCAIKFFITRS